MPDLNTVPNLVPNPHPKHTSLVPIVYIGLALIASTAMAAWAWQTFSGDEGTNTNVTNTVLNSNQAANTNTSVNTNASINTNSTDNSNAPVPTNTNTSVNTNSSIYAPTKAYTNSTTKVSFEYPNDLQVNECSDGMMTFVSDVPVLCDTEAGSAAFSITQQDEAYDRVTDIAETNANLVSPVETSIVVDGVNGTRLQGVTKTTADGYFDENRYQDTVFLTVNGTSYRITAHSTTNTPFRSSDFSLFLSSINF